jgi:elongation factor G
MALRRSPALLNPSLLRNVGILAHVDAGKTTLTEHFVSLATQRPAGSVDEGSTVTDFLASERERGITIQSACLSLPWPPSPAEGAPRTRVNVIDTPGHVDFGVEVARSVAVLDGGVLVVDAVEGVQAQTETVWGAMQKRGGEAKPLPCLAVINKLDRVGADFGRAIGTLNKRLKRQEGGGRRTRRRCSCRWCGARRAGR